jgi:hypothetical protein
VFPFVPNPSDLCYLIVCHHFRFADGISPRANDLLPNLSDSIRLQSTQDTRKEAATTVYRAEMIAKRDSDWRKQLDNGRAAKRQRSETEPFGAADENVGDYYDEIVGGHVNGQIRNSWLRCIHRSGSQHDPCNGSGDDLASALQSLTRQLLQTKRRLWPAAEHCAQAHDSKPGEEFAEARRMEPLGEGRNEGLNQMFMNRAAIKLANIDAILDFALTAGNDENFFFIDLCGGPGGFSEVRKDKESVPSFCLRSF